MREMVGKRRDKKQRRSPYLPRKTNPLELATGGAVESSNTSH